MVEVKDIGGDASFNQAAFQQSRIHELFAKVDRLSGDLFSIDMETGKWAYEAAYNHLNSILATISPKLATKELIFLTKFKKFIRDFMELKPIWIESEDINFNGIQDARTPNTDNRNSLSDFIFDYRLEIEHYMDIHGLSNPDKEGEGGWD